MKTGTPFFLKHTEKDRSIWNSCGAQLVKFCLNSGRGRADLISKSLHRSSRFSMTFRLCLFSQWDQYQDARTERSQDSSREASIASPVWLIRERLGRAHRRNHCAYGNRRLVIVGASFALDCGTTNLQVSAAIVVLAIVAAIFFRRLSATEPNRAPAGGSY